MVRNIELRYGQIDFYIAETVVKQTLIAGDQNMPLIEASNINLVACGQGQRISLHLQVFKRSCYILPFGQVS